EGFSELAVGLLPFLLPGKIARVEDYGSPDLRRHGKAVGHHLDACPADGLEEAGNVHPMVGGMEDEACGIALEQIGISNKMGALVHHLDEAGEGREPVQGYGQRLFKEAVG